MEPVLFFYSTDGTAAFGPVTEDALRQLFKDQLIGPGSFICPVGETEWKPVDLDWLRRPPPQTLRLPRYEPPPYVPTGTAKQREEQRVQQLEEVWDYGPHPGAIKWGCVAFASVMTLVLAVMQDGFLNILVGLLVGVVFLFLIPYVISQSFKRAWRWRAWAMAIAVFSVMTFVGEASYEQLVREAESIKLADPTVPAPQPLAQKSVAPASAPVVDPDEAKRMVQIAQPVEQEMIDKVKASDAAEKACGNFDPASLATEAELATLRDGITSLRAAQASVLAYFQTYDDRCRTALANNGFTSDGIERFVAGVHQSGHIDQAVAIWQVRIKLTDDHLARLDFLDKRWGTWQAKDGKLLFTNQADLDAYNTLTQNLVADIKQGQDLQSQVSAK